MTASCVASPAVSSWTRTGSRIPPRTPGCWRFAAVHRGAAANGPGSRRPCDGSCGGADGAKLVDDNARQWRQTATPPPSVDVLLEREAQRRRVVSAVVSLPEPYRRTVMLRYLEGLPPRLIAQRDDVPVETVRTRLKRGLDRMRRELDAECGDSEFWIASLVPLLTLPLSFRLNGLLAGLSARIEGVIAMSLKTKLIVGAVVLAAAFLLWLERDYVADGLSADGTSIDQSVDLQAREPLRGEGESGSETPSPAADDSETKETVEDNDPKEDFPFGRLELEVVYRRDQSPGAHLPIRLLPIGGPDPFFHEIHPRTDAAGRVVLEKWPAGRTMAICILGGSKRFAVKGGETTKERLEIPEGLFVKGRVINDTDRPVSGAEIFVADMGHPFRGSPVTHSGVDGRFTIRDGRADGFFLVGALAAGKLPSATAILMGSAGSEHEIELKIGGPAGGLDLEVVDVDGQPVAGARVLIGNNTHEQFQLPSGTLACGTKPLDRRTDREGRLHFTSLLPGDNPLSIREPRFAPWSGTVSSVAGATATLRVTLGPSGSVEGRILDALGNPKAKIEVKIGRYGDFMASFVRTDADGRYRIDGVAPGTREIIADADVEGQVKDEIEIRADEVAHWDAQLELGPSIKGIVVDESGNPLAGYSVRVQSFESGDYLMRFARSDEQGRFEAKNLRDAEFEVSVDSKRGTGTLVREEQKVRPGGDPIRLVVPLDKLGVASITGIIVDENGEALASAEISGFRQDGGGGTRIYMAEAGTGRFTMKEVTPGKYSFTVSAQGYGHQSFRDFEAKDGESLDVGALRLQATGRLEVRLAEGLALDHAKAKLWARRLDHGPTIVIEIDGARTVSQPLMPGNWRLSFRSPGQAAPQVEAVVESGETRVVDLDVGAGRELKLVYRGRGRRRAVGADRTHDSGRAGASRVSGEPEAVERSTLDRSPLSESRGT